MRHKIKTIITALAITISVAVYIFADAWLEGINLDSKRNIVSYETGAAKMQTRLYFEKKDESPMYENFADWERYVDILQDNGYDTAPRFVFTGTLYSAVGSAPVEFNAVNPVADSRLLRYSSYMESGRFIEPGSFEIVLGTMAAHKLKVGIPQRLTMREMEQELIPYGQNEDNRIFIKSLYEPLQQVNRRNNKKQPENDSDHDEGEDRLVLRENLPEQSLERFWALLNDYGRMNVRVSTVIDIKELPQTISEVRFDVDIDPYLVKDEKEIFLSAYAYDPASQTYIFTSDDEITGRRVLNILAGHNYSGAIRHVNQLMDFKVVGIINSPDPKNNANVAYIPMDVLQDETGLMLEGHITELLIRKQNVSDAALPGREESPELIQSILADTLHEQGWEFPPELGVYGWLDYASDFIATAKGDNIMARVMTILLFILAFIGIANSMLMSILERTKEIGMIRALGMTDLEIVITYMLEAGFVGFIGSVAGITLSCIVNIPMVTHGINFSSMVQETNGDFGYRVASLFRSTWRPQIIIGAGIIATILSSVMASLPTYRSIKMPITESLRFE
jgi:ABC-type lipoprotein release transport system permease subunit